MRARRRSGWIGSRRSAGKGGVVKGELSATAGGDCAGGFIRRSFLFYLQTRVPTVLPVWSESWRAPCRGGALEMVGFKEKEAGPPYAGGARGIAQALLHYAAVDHIRCKASHEAERAHATDLRRAPPQL